MAAHTSLLLVIVFCAATTHSLQCYTCTLQTNNANCQTATNCSSNQVYCKTVLGTVSAGGLTGTAITKTCEQTCSPSSGIVSGAAISVTCCSTDQCNSAAGSGVSIKSSYAAIFLALGSILAILKSSML